MTSDNVTSAQKGAVMALPGWSVAGMQLVNPGAGQADFAPSILCQLRVDAGQGAVPDIVARADLSKLRAIPGATVHGERSRNLDAGARVSEIDIEMPGAAAADPRLRQIMWFFSTGGHVYTLVGSYLSGAAFEKARPELERGLAGMVSFIRGVSP